MDGVEGAAALRTFADAVLAVWSAINHYELVYGEWAQRVELAAGVTFDPETRSHFGRGGKAVGQVPALDARGIQEDEDGCAIAEQGYDAVVARFNDAQDLARELAQHLGSSFHAPSEHQTQAALLLLNLRRDFPHSAPTPASLIGGPVRVREDYEELRRYMEAARVSSNLQDLLDWARCAADAKRDTAGEVRSNAGTGGEAPPLDPRVTKPPSGRLSASDLAAYYRLDPELTRKALQRWRAKNKGSRAFAEVEDRGPHDPQFLYDATEVLPVLVKRYAAAMRRRSSG